MGFQKEVNLYPAAGVPGQQAGLNPIAHLIPVPVAGADGVVTVNAVWYDTQPGTVKNAGTGAPLGIAQRVLTGIIPASEEATMTILAGHSVAVVIRGDLLVSSASAVTAGQKVFANLATGALTGGTAGGTVEGAVETDWIIRESAAAGDVFHISNW